MKLTFPLIWSYSGHECRFFAEGGARSGLTRIPFSQHFNLIIVNKLICTLTFSAVFGFGSTLLAAPHKLRVHDSAVANMLVAKGGKTIAQYGAFTVLEADDSALAGLDTNRLEITDDWNFIRLNARLMDTRAPEIKALRKPRGAFAGKRLHLVQFAGPLKTEWFEALKESGAQIITYIPENTYLIYGDAPSLARMQSWAGGSPSVQWEGEYTGDLKVHPDARTANTFSIQLVADAVENARTLALINNLKTATVESDYEMEPYRNVIVSLPAGRLDAIAAEPDVVSIQPYVEPKKRDERQDQIVAGNLSGDQPSGPGYLAWLASKGFTQAQFDASGFVVDVADAGVDNGTSTPGHFGFYNSGDPAQANRLAYARFTGHPHFDGTLSGCDGHGALNAHIIANYDAYAGSQHQDASGFSYGVGICPFVRIGSSVIFDNSSGPSDFTNPSYPKMLNDAYNSGARIQNNSWGSDVGGRYDATSQTYDRLVRDSATNLPGDQEMVIVFAAGNAGPCGGTSPVGIDSPGSAKNLITVGASDNVRSLSSANGGVDSSGDDGCSLTDADASSANDMACFSSQGPCSDGRMKPDLVAPGVHITGGVPQVLPPPSPSGTGTVIDCYNASGVCALWVNSLPTGDPNNPTNFFPMGQQFYTVSSGTSHSTPAVAGACALVRQYFINSGSTPPSPAMTKAFLMNSTRYMTGSGADDSLWSPSQGMGEVNLGTAFDGTARYLRDELPQEMFTATGQLRMYGGQVADPTQPFRVTIAWTDAPGNTTGAAYNNDLDLAVTVGGNTYLGNVFSGQYSTTGGSADRKNNVESVFLPAGVTGGFTVSVTAANINSIGVPGGGPAQKSLNQDFALVIYNGTATNIATFNPITASYNGLFYESSGVELGRSGAITLATGASGSYSGKLQLGATSYPFTGSFDSQGMATNAVVRKGGNPLTLNMAVDLQDPDVITGTVTDNSTWTADVRATRATLSPENPPTPGNYTLIFAGTNGNGQLPAGNGYGTANLSAAGKIKFSGALSDDTKVSQSAAISTMGEWPLYASLYKGQGQILGWLVFTNGSPATLGGGVDWIKSPIGSAKFYSNGFNFETTATGSFFNPSAAPLIGFSNGVVVLSSGNLSSDIVNDVTVTNNTKVLNVSSNKLTLKLSASKGTFSGTVVDPATGTSRAFNGVFLQNEDLGLGFSLGTNQSSSVLFGPPD